MIHVPVVIYQERIIEVPKVEYVEKIESAPGNQYQQWQPKCIYHAVNWYSNILCFDFEIFGMSKYELNEISVKS